MTFSVVATSGTTMSYQWLKNGANIKDAKSSTYTIASVQTTDAATYTVKVTNAGGTVTSSDATLTVLVPPMITTQPLSQTVTQGLPAALSVAASGTAPLSYQWQYLGNNVDGATDATLVLTNMQFVQAGSYSVTVSDVAGTTASAPAFLTVIPPPGSDRPVMQDLVAHLTFDGDLADSSGRGNHAAAVGAPNLVRGFIGAGGFNPFTQDGANNYATLGTGSDFSFDKATDFTIAFWARLPADGWNGSSTHSDPAFISNKDWSDGENAGWVLATGDDGRLQWNYREAGTETRKDYDGPGGVFGNPVWHHVAVTFQRTGNAITYFDGVPVSTNSIGPGDKVIDSGLPTNIGNDGTGNYPTYLGYWTNAWANPTNGLNMDDVGIWRRVLPAQEIAAIYNVGQAGRDLATVSSFDVAAAGPLITTVPITAAQDTYIRSTATTLNYGTSTSLVVDRSGGGIGNQRALVQFDLSSIPPGATITNATLQMQATANGGAFNINIYRVTQSWAEGSGNSTAGAANWNQRVTGTAWSSAGGAYNATAVATLNTGLIGQHDWNLTALVRDWYDGTTVNNGIIIGSPNTGTTTITYDSKEGATPPRLAITYYLAPVNTVPAITQQPISVQCYAGGSVTFAVTASGTAPLRYQWYGNGAPLAGGTNAALTVSNVQPAQAGDYWVVITNSAGSATSAVATLAVATPPSITTQPLGQTVMAGQTASFSVGATGTAPLSYQWSLNGTALAGATSSTLTLNNVQTTDAGNYTVVVANIAGSVPSAEALLTVTNPPPTAPPSLVAAAMTPNGFTFQLSVPLRQSYVILASTDLRDWTPIYTNIALTASVVLTDTTATNYSLRYYRAMVSHSTAILQQNTSGGNKMDIKLGQKGAQSFRHGTAGAADYTISKIVLHLSRETEAPNANLNFNLGRGINSGAIVGSSTTIAPASITNTSAGNSFQTYEIAFETPVGPLTSGTTYYLNLECEGSNGKTIYAEYAGSSTYPNGTYYKDGDNDGKDIWFQIWGQ